MSLFGPSFMHANMGSRRGLMAPAPIVQLGGGLRMTTIQIEGAEINTIDTTPKTLVNALGATSLIVPVSFFLRTKKIAGGAGINRAMMFRYAGTTVQLQSGSVTALWGNGGGAAAVDQWMGTQMTSSPLFPAATDLRGRALEVLASGDAGTIPAGSFLTVVIQWGAVATVG